MGYFSNGAEGLDYEARYCARCVHEYDADGRGCAIWAVHLERNYDECNNDASILHLLIPRTTDGLDNAQCALFWAKAKP